MSAAALSIIDILRLISNDDGNNNNNFFPSPGVYDFPPAVFTPLFFGGGPDHQGGMFAATMFLGGPAMMQQQPARHIVGLPRPISTADFPDVSAPEVAPLRIKRARSTTAGSGRPPRKLMKHASPAVVCCICLETVGCGAPRAAEDSPPPPPCPLMGATPLALQPCGHVMHTGCMCAVVVPAGAAGAEAVVRCPLCRAALDRYDLGTMGFDVRPCALRVGAARCNALRHLRDGTLGAAVNTAQGESRGHALARVLGICRDVSMRDGFVYNVCVLGIERALYHRRELAIALHAELLRAPPPPPTATYVYDMVQVALGVHIDFLMKAGREAHEDENDDATG